MCRNVQLLCLASTVRVAPFPRGKAQQMCVSGRALRGLKADPHSLLQFLDGWTHTFVIAPLFTFAEGANQP
ncbi:hypothetical protein Y5S_03455 [Alcanivorax nanhaiticus]|uniref:Uncharacterized protein n=1 Tax=Alcanivorax nanhaiticus TaxID=1177154 RepID=A0A095ULA9_9GAMM|nr:hypothetical protein Y5S_03455 [Alcanivorax nanhaiticus]